MDENEYEQCSRRVCLGDTVKGKGFGNCVPCVKYVDKLGIHADPFTGGSYADEVTLGFDVGSMRHLPVDDLFERSGEKPRPWEECFSCCGKTSNSIPMVDKLPEIEDEEGMT